MGKRSEEFEDTIDSEFQPQINLGANSAQSTKSTDKIIRELNYSPNKDTQKTLNQPLVSSENLDKEDKKFLELLLNLIENDEIDFFKPSSLMNLETYESLPPQSKATAEIEALNLIQTFRQIHKLYQAKLTDTYQFINGLKQFRHTKERIEAELGDIYKI